jgi:precorrin-3B synthase
METGDGWLARVPPQEGPLALDALRGLCAAARAHGNGILEVTRRGNFQIRGLQPETVQGFADALLALGIAIEPGPPIQTSPLSGRDPGEVLDLRPLAAALRARLGDAPFRSELGPKVSLTLDSGGAVHLDGLDADLRLRAEAGPGGVRLHVGIGGDGQSATALGTLAPEHALEGMATLAAVLAKRGREARARDVLRREGAEVFRMGLAGLLAPADLPPQRGRAEPIGAHALRGGRVALGVGLAFGQSDADALEELCDAASAAGASALAPAAEHCALLLDVDPARAAELRDAAERHGFIARADDPRRHISACSGAPACAAARMPTRSQGAALALAAGPMLDGSLRIHLSGCAKGCAHPGPSALALVGVDGGCGVVVAGSAHAEPLGYVACESLEPRLERLSRWVLAAREPGEDSAAVLKRFGVGGVAHALGVPRKSA